MSTVGGGAYPTKTDPAASGEASKLFHRICVMQVYNRGSTPLCVCAYVCVYRELIVCEGQCVRVRVSV